MIKMNPGNTVELVDGYIFITLKGNQNYETMSSVAKCVHLLSSEVQPVNLVVDMRDHAQTSMGARRAAAYGARLVNFDKLIVFGATPYLTRVLKIIARATGKTDKFYFVRSRAEALRVLSAPVTK